MEAQNRLSMLDDMDTMVGTSGPNTQGGSLGQRKTVVHRHFSSIGTAEESNGVPKSARVPKGHPQEGSATPVASISLASILRSPIVTVSVEISAGNHDTVAFYDGDNPKDVAAAFVQKHKLHSAKVLEPLTAHFESILNQHSRKAQVNAAADRQSQQQLREHHAQPQKDQKVPGKRPTTYEANPAAESSPDGLPVAGPSQSHLGDRCLKPRSENARGMVKKFGNVHSRYLSPAPKRAPPPPPPTFVHSPAISRGSKRLVEQREAAAGGHHQPAYARLFQLNNPCVITPQPQPTVQRSSSVPRSPSVRTASPGEAGRRLHQQAVLQREKLRLLAEKEKLRAEAKELDGATFQPQTNRSNSASRRHRDPYCGATPLAKPRPLSTEQIVLQEKCTFHPSVNKSIHEVRKLTEKNSPPQVVTASSSLQQQPVTSSTIANPSPTRQLSYATSHEEMKHKAQTSGRHRTAGQCAAPLNRQQMPHRSEPPIRSVEEPTNIEEHGQSLSRKKQQEVRKDVFTRLLTSQEQYRAKLAERRRYHDSTDPQTGLPLFRPFLGR